MTAITHTPDLHTHAGARWLAPFVVVLLATLVATLALIVQPYVSR